MIEVTLAWSVLLRVKGVCALYNQIFRDLIVVAPNCVLYERVNGWATRVVRVRANLWGRHNSLRRELVLGGEH